MRAAASALTGAATGAGVVLGAVAASGAAAPRAAAPAAASDGPLAPATLTSVSAPAVPSAAGLAEPDGSLYGLSGSFPPLGPLAAPVVGWAPRPGGGVWEVAADGGVFARGGAPFYGSAGNLRLSKPVVGIASTPTGHGYWLVASDGGVFSYGDARFHGSAGGLRLARPVVGMASTSTGNGYWLAAADGGVFSYGDAGFNGSGAGRTAAPAVSVTAAGSGYDIVFADGNLWDFRPAAAPVRQSLGVPAAELAAVRQAAAAQKAVSVALSEAGKPYVYGAAGPNAFDCSGLTAYSYAAAGVGLPRTAAEQFAAVPRVSVATMRPGDLLFFYPGITHVGIYIGNGLMVDAPHVGSVVRVEQYQWFGPLMGVGRPGA